jgi:hypothetical protein
MSQDQSKTLPRLPWWFWLMLLAPAFVALAGTAIIFAFGKGPGGLFLVNVLIALPLNFVCSNATAKQLALLCDSRGACSPRMFLWGPLIFFLNVAMVFGGCAVLEQHAFPSR